jgi:hypothetical protein
MGWDVNEHGVAGCHPFPHAFRILENVVYLSISDPQSTTMRDEQLAILANTHRRQLLTALMQTSSHDTRLSPPETGLTDGGTQREAVAMHHIHLPKLADYGYIDWDREAHTVEKGPQFEDIKPLLTVLNEHAPSLTESRDSK